jgi:beta-galactosidase
MKMKCLHLLLTLHLTLAAALAADSTPRPEASPRPRAVRNQDIYPPADSAKAAIDFDSKGFIINGRHTYIASGSIHYARVPHELWGDRLLRLKQANFNCVQTYIFWNFQEPVKDRFDFTGDKDVEAFLETAQKMGLYATIRPGPYVCAEWDSGGYPVWLKFEPNLTSIRTNNPVWQALNDHWYDKILPIIARHQIHRGGNVILVQLENEHPLGWGVIPNDPYFVHLHDDAVRDGIEVPHFMSGMNHGGSPSPGNIIDGSRTTPWYSTEFWAGWFDDYRLLSNKKFRQIVSANWSIMAHGGAGQNYYMIHGGSNFDSWSDDSTGASYDYGAAIGQAGDLRPIYYQMKRANQLAQSFPGILGDSTDALPAYKDFVSGANVSVNGARKSDAGTLVFIENNSAADATATFKSGETLRMTRYANYPLAENATIAEGVKIVDSTAPVLGVAHNDHIVTVIVYGQPGETGRLTLSASGGVTSGSTSAAFASDLSNPDKINLKITFPSTGAEECLLNRAGVAIRVLAINQDLSLYTWILGPSDKQYVIFGPAFVSGVEKGPAGTLAVTIERPYGRPSRGQVAVYGGLNESWHLAAKGDASVESQPAPILTDWRMAAATQAAPEYDDSKWTQSGQPPQMGADGDYSAFAWYRATVDLPNAGSGRLRLQGKDNLEVFINGKHAGSGAGLVTANVVAGRNTIAVFVSHNGRAKAFAYLGPLNTYSVKGLTAATLTVNGETKQVTGWKLHGGPAETSALPASWTATGDTDGIPAFYQASFMAKPPGDLGAHPILRVNYAGLTRGMIWVNGHSLGRYPEKIHLDSLYIPECWIKDGENSLTIFDETGAGPQKVRLLVEAPASREVIRATEPIDPATPIVAPAENPVIDLAAMNRDNLAFRCAASASYTVKETGAATMVDSVAAVTDGDPDSDWGPPEPKMVGSATVEVDLGKSVGVKVCEILFGSKANGYEYVLEGSNDNQAWTRLGDQTTAVPTSPDSPSELARLNLAGDNYRYLRVTMNGGRNFTVAEVRAYGDRK